MTDFNLEFAEDGNATNTGTLNLTGENGVATDVNYVVRGSAGNATVGSDASFTGFSGADSPDSSAALIEFDFSNAVTDLTFDLLDINENPLPFLGWDDQVRVVAFDADGNPTPITFSQTGLLNEVVENDGSSGTLQLDGTLTSGQGTSVAISGPVARVEIYYEDGSTLPNTFGSIDIGNFSFQDAIQEGPNGVVDGEDTDDLIDLGYDDSGQATNGGGDVVTTGDDSIEGNGGNDLIDGDAGNDTISGGSDNDSILGGAGDDVLSGDAGTSEVGLGQDTTSGLNLDIANLNFDSSTGNNNAQIGDFAVYSNVATLPDGTPISARLILTETSDPALDVDLSGLAGAEILLNGDGNPAFLGETATFRLEFFDPVSGDDVSLSSVATFSDLDRNDGAEQVEVMVDDFSNFQVSQTSTLNLIVDGVSARAIATTDTTPDDEDAWFSAGFENQSAITFRLTSREVNSGYTLNGQSIDDPNVTPFNPGDDTIDGGEGNDIIAGEAGNDSLIGGDGSDSIDGGSGADTILAGAGDYVFGGDDADIIAVDASAQDFDGGAPSGITINGGDGGTDSDRLDLTDYAYYDPATLSQTADADGNSSSGSVTVFDGSGNPVVITFAEIETLDLPPVGPLPNGIVDGEETGETMVLGYNDDNTPTNGGADQITNAADSIEGNGGNDIIDGAGGDDRIDGGADDDTLFGGDGVDTLFGGTGNDRLEGGQGSGNELFGGEGEDLLFNGAGDDTAFGGQGNDTIHADQGNDLIQGDGGDDTFIVENTFGPYGNDTIVGGETGETNGDLIDASGMNAGLTVTSTGDEAGTMSDGVSTATYSEIEEFILSDFDDTADFSADGSGVGVRAGGGADSIIGGTGDDLVIGGAGNDTIAGLDGHDRLQGDEGDDVLHGDGGTDTLWGGDGDDRLFGGADDDSLLGGLGADTLVGGIGADTFDGGADDDTFVLGVGDMAAGTAGDDVFTFDPSLTEGPGTIVVVGGEADEGGADTTNDNYPGAPNPTGDVVDLTGLNNATVQFEDPSGNPVAGPTEQGTITYTDNNGDLVTVNFSEIENVIFCFARGTLIETANGPQKVEDLAVGDLAETRDNGFQAIRWIGSRKVPAVGKLAPITFKAGALGNDTDLSVSPQHRMLIEGWKAEILFGESEVLTPAKHLVNGDTVFVNHGGEVEYFHILFDSHELVLANGAWSESFHPGEEGFDTLNDAAREEIFDLFPELRGDLSNYPSHTRVTLRRKEAELLRDYPEAAE